uniref:Uncharacterized protein n=1 Tax=Anguilla anguilla TaxID=7936 RepID=A0A0E9PJ81_ANGAN
MTSTDLAISLISPLVFRDDFDYGLCVLAVHGLH